MHHFLVAKIHQVSATSVYVAFRRFRIQHAQNGQPTVPGNRQQGVGDQLIRNNDGPETIFQPFIRHGVSVRSHLPIQSAAAAGLQRERRVVSFDDGEPHQNAPSLRRNTGGQLHRVPVPPPVYVFDRSQTRLGAARKTSANRKMKYLNRLRRTEIHARAQILKIINKILKDTGIHIVSPQ